MLHPQRFTRWPLIGLLVSATSIVASSAAPPKALGQSPSAAVEAPSQAVKLRVRAKGSGTPVGRVEVKAAGGKTFTGKDGTAAVNIPAGEGAVELYRHSFEPLRLEFQELRGKSEFEVFLLPSTPPDNEVLVQGAKRPEASRKSVAIEEAIKVAPGGDPAQVPKLLPGVQSSGFSPAIIVRGSGPNDSRYFIDNWSVPFIFHRIGGISIIPDQILSGVEFSSGGFGAQYGGATGGVVTLQTKSELPERPVTEFRVNVPVFSSIYHERPIGDSATVAVSARRSYLEAFLPALLPADAGLTVVPYFGDTHLYYHRATEDGHVKLMALYAYDGLKAAFSSDQAVDEDGRGRFSLSDQVSTLGFEWRKILNREWSLTVSPQLTDVQSNIDIIDNRIHIGASSLGLHGEVTRRLGGQDKLYLGSLIEITHAEADVLAPRPDFNDPFFDFEEAPKVETKMTALYQDYAAWVAADKELGDLTITPGLRAFHASRINASGADPRLNARYKLSESHALKTAIGQYSQAPEFADASEDFGNPNLKFIRSHHYVLGIETQWNERWLTDFQVFYKETKDAVRSDSQTNRNNDGSLISGGFETFIRRNLTQRLFGWLSYTYSRTQERDNNQETYRNSQYDQTHVANLVGNYKLTAQWELGGRLIYHTGDTYTTVDNAVYNANLDKYQARSAQGARLYNARLPSYHELDLYANKDILFDTWKMGLRFGIEFLALEPQAQGVQHNYDYSKEEFFRGVPPIPYIEIRGTL